MLIVIQRVAEARVVVDNHTVAQIDQGLAILCGFEPHDTTTTLQRMLDKCLHYRIFSDAQDKMNSSIQDVNGGLLLIPQFTLIADTQKGLRPGFSKAAHPQLGKELFTELLQIARQKYTNVQQGIFGADMQVYLCNDGPATFLMSF